MTKILAIETSSELASCALLNGDTVLSRQSTGVRTHSQSILPMVQELLAEAGLALKDLDAIAFGAGPGSFTGVRTACGIAQGLAFGSGLPAIPVVTLAAMALACRQRTGAADVLAVLDARMGEVYWAQYRYADGWQTVIEPALCAPDGVASIGPVTACGNGLPGSELADVMPHAAQVAQLAALEFAAGRTVSAAHAQPIYLRNKIAYTSAERQVINAAKASA